MSKGRKRSGASCGESRSQRARSLPPLSSGLAYVLHPTARDAFFASTFERDSIVIPHAAPAAAAAAAAPPPATKGAGLFTLEALLELLDAEDVELYFGEHINVFEFVDGAKQMRNPAPRAVDGAGDVLATRAAIVELMARGCSLQFHQPQQHSAALHELLAGMEAQFGCLVGANIYITPAGAQGLAPHHDDIEAFVLQLEGEKDWCVYAPVAPEKALPALYSDDIPPQRLAGRTPRRHTLAPGDLLYFPRGWIHFAKARGGAHSTHVTISTYQRWTWGDFVGAAAPRALSALAAREATPLLRRGLPPRFAHQNQTSPPRRAEAKRTLRALLAAPGMIDALADEMLDGGR